MFAETRGVVACALGVALHLLVTTSPAQADLPDRSFYIGPFAGVTLRPDDWDIHEIPDAGVSPTIASFTGGLRVGGAVARWVGLEAGLAVIPYRFEDDQGSGVALAFTGDLHVNLLGSGSWIPFLAVGGGGYAGFEDGFGSDVDWRAQWGVGLRGPLADWVVLRVDARHVLTDGYEPDLFIANNLELLVGVDFPLYRGVDEPPPPVDDDWDKDGIVNDDDACPRVPGHPSASGCPDRDGDAIQDGEDRCPETAGPREHRGCPDADGDGLPDLEDRCPKEAGAGGLKGCPDRDGDGVADLDDQCPDEAGVAERFGCPEQKPVVLEGVEFDYDRATLRPAALQVLDRSARTLKDHPRLRVRIVGYTDDRGGDAYNDELSLARAEAVRQYLVDRHGIAPERLTAEGRGERDPRGSNETDEGRARNRRIEFVLEARE